MGLTRFARLTLVAMSLWGSSTALAAAPENPLQPPDRSSPRATLVTFLAAGDAAAQAFREGANHSFQGSRRLFRLSQPAFRCLDMSHLPAASRLKAGGAAALALYQVMNRIRLPPLDQIPDAEQMAQRKDGAGKYWTLPGTEITFVRVEQGAAGVEYLFSPETVSRAAEFEERTRGLPPVRADVPDLHAMMVEGGGWMIPYGWIESLPTVLRTPVGGQASWKWIALVLLLVAMLPLLWVAARLSRLGEGRSPLVRAVARFAVPLALIVAVPVFGFLAFVQVNVMGEVAIAMQVGMNVFLAMLAAWVCWRAAPVVAEAIIATPRVAPEGVDAALIRLAARIVGIAGSLALLSAGASRLGIPVYGIVAGLGVGGIAVALAAQPTLENFIAGLNLFADRSLRVGDKCKVGETRGRVESIGLRSTRIRTDDRAVTTIPNGAVARASILNLSSRDHMQLETVIGLRYETTPAQLRAILSSIEAMITSHPRVLAEGNRVRFVAFGASSLDVQVRAQIATTSTGEFAAIRQEILLRIMDIVEQGGSAFAFPSTTLYLGRDHPPGGGKAG